MIETQITVQDDFKRVADAAKTAKFENLRHGGLSVAKQAKSLIKTSSKSSRPGQPPTTRAQSGHNLRGAIFSDADEDSAMIGPRHSFVGESGRAHELGEDFEGDSFDERAFMKPSLEYSVPRWHADWAGSIGE